ncbi:MAG: hypothetical protein FWH35_00705 [Treponema sp.]|nr:hypothetical protein [Treponema sp.]
MELQKSPAGKVLIGLYYAVFGILLFILIMLVMFKIGILIGLGLGLLLGLAIGVLGGKLEYEEHIKVSSRKYTRQGIKDYKNKILPFPCGKGTRVS